MIRLQLLSEPASLILASAVDGAGTVECITLVYDSVPDMEVMTRGNYAVVPYVIPGKYVCYKLSPYRRSAYKMVSGYDCKERKGRGGTRENNGK